MDKINVTQQNIKHKRKLLAQRRRRARLRLLILLLFLGVIVTGVLFAGYALVSLGSKLNQEYQTMYEGYTQRQQMRRGTIDPRFDGYTNVLIVGLDEGVDIDGSTAKKAALYSYPAGYLGECHWQSGANKNKIPLCHGGRPHADTSGQ